MSGVQTIRVRNIVALQHAMDYCVYWGINKGYLDPRAPYLIHFQMVDQVVAPGELARREWVRGRDYSKKLIRFDVRHAENIRNAVQYLLEAGIKPNMIITESSDDQ